MEQSPPTRLNLCAPLKYAEMPPSTAVGPDSFDCLFHQVEDAPELLLCFEIDRRQGGRIDPQADGFLERLVFSGKGDGKAAGSKREVCLPAGQYLFTQKRKILDRGECIGMAIEQQKDGLWERLRLENRLYIRCLAEDGGRVTQFFRPII
jgi:hypothetical protein